ncbi:hypothetical protein Tco_0200136 [Tanacetum coccineum]
MQDVQEEDENIKEDVQEVVAVVKAAKLISEVVSIAGVNYNAASVQDISVSAARPSKATKVTVEVPTPKRRRGVIIKDLKELTTTRVTAQPKSRKEQIQADAELAKELEVEWNADINWNDVIEQVQRRDSQEDNLKNMAGYKINSFKGMSYDEIRPLFKVEYNKVQTFLNKKGSEINAERIKAPRKRTREDKVEKDQSDKKQKGNENAKTFEEEDDTKEIKRCLEIVPDDGDLLVDAIPLAERSPTVVDYRVYKKGKKKFYQVFREHGNYQMLFTFKKLLVNFNREDLECLCKIVKE